VDILHTHHWKKGDNGQYFYFNEREFNKMVGNEDWNGKTFLMVQEGSHSWSGRVVVWKGNSRSGAHGRRYNNRGETGQWESGDVIKLASCDIEG